MLSDALMRIRQGRNDFLSTDDKDQIRRGKSEMRELTSGGRNNNQFSRPGKRMNTTQVEIGNDRILSQLRLFCGMLFRKNGIVEIVPAMPAPAYIVYEPNLLQCAGGAVHHRRSFRNKFFYPGKGFDT